MDGHKKWIQQGFDEGVFLFVGSIELNGRGAILANDTMPMELKNRVNEDPFVVETSSQRKFWKSRQAELIND